MEYKITRHEICKSPLTFFFSCTPRREGRCNNTCQKHPTGAWKGDIHVDEQGHPQCYTIFSTNINKGPGCKMMLFVSYLCSVLHAGLVRMAFNYDLVPLSAEDLISSCRTGNNFKALASEPMASKHESHVTPLKVLPFQ